MESYGARSISVFFPAFNDEKTIASLVGDVSAILPTLTDDYEVIVVNDGSTDATPALLDDLARTLPHVRVVHHARNRGYGAALRSGFSHARKDLIFYTDGDGQYDPRDLTLLLPMMTDAVDVANGYKVKRADKRHRIILGGVYNRLARLMFRIPIRDVDCDFRLMRRSAVQQLDLVSSSGVICVELMSKLRTAGCVFAETPVPHHPRAYGRSQFFTLRRVARTALDFLGLWVKLMALPRFARSPSRRRGLIAEGDLLD